LKGDHNKTSRMRSTNHNCNNRTTRIRYCDIFLGSCLSINNKTTLAIHHRHCQTIERYSSTPYNTDRHYFSPNSSFPVLLPLLRGGGGNDKINDVNTPQTMTPTNFHHHEQQKEKHRYNLLKRRQRIIETHPRLGMWEKCIYIIALYITTGTIFYHKLNNWPLATSYFYTVDAGLSVGFCMNGLVDETNLASRAFSVVLILLGASVVGGVLALFVDDVLQGTMSFMKGEYRLMLEEDAFRRYDTNGDGVISKEEMMILLERVVGVEGNHEDDDKGGQKAKREKLREIYKELLEKKEKDNGNNDGNSGMTLREFIGFFREMEDILEDSTNINSTTFKGRGQWQRYQQRGSGMIGRFFQKFQDGSFYTLYIVFVLYVGLGVLWGMKNQKWDPITSTHFALSLLVTGELTDPRINEYGTLPSNVAMFVGTYCLFGIPLFYCIIGRFAHNLVKGHLSNVERSIINTPLKPYEYDLVARSLCTPNDEYIHLSDFVVMHFLKRGHTDVDIVRLMKNQFEKLDLDGDGALTFEEATRGLERFYTGDNGH